MRGKARMQKRSLGDTLVTPIGFGAMPVDEYNPKAKKEEAIELFRYAAAHGIEFMDTADVYGLGRNETMLGQALTAEQKLSIVVGTKGGCTRPDGGWDSDGRPEHLQQAVQDSLARLQVKQIYLYQLHTPDHRIPFLETITALKAIQEAGYVKHLGLSNVSVDQLKQAQKIIKVVSVQNHFNLMVKKDEAELLPYLTEQGIAYIPYFPLGGGKVLGNPQLQKIATRLGKTASQVALAWILHRWKTAIPIPGTTNKLHFEENMDAVDVSLSDDIIEQLDQLY